MDSKYVVFIVEDDQMYAKLIKYHLSMNKEYEIHVFETGKECLENLHLNPFVVSLDFTLPDMTGKDVLKGIKSHNKDIAVIVVSGQEKIDVAVDLLKNGANEYLMKDKNTKDILWRSIAKYKENTSLKREVDLLKAEISRKYSFKNFLIGDSLSMKHVFRMIEKASTSNITVSISGESGTGKEMVAKAIHYNSKLAKGNYIPIDLSAIPSELLESELFGYERGAFTGASTRKIGKFELANNGTLFLDEIGDMPLTMQTKLLRVLQERELTRVGGLKPIKITARIIVATNRNLKELVKNGQFREDLYYRILGLPIELPPLRERGKDVLLLADHFRKEYVLKNDLPKLKFSNEAKRKLLNYAYPGNVRELKSVVELACVLAGDKIITDSEITFNSVDESYTFLTTEMTLKEYSRRIVRHYMDKYGQNINLVSKKLDIGRSSIYRMLKYKEI
jgi:DNA-binding NtrC family response regulator